MTIEYYTQKPNEPLSRGPIFALHSLQVYHSVNVHPVRLPARNAVFTVQRVLPVFLKQLTPSPLSGSAIRAPTFARPFLSSSPPPRVKCLGHPRPRIHLRKQRSLIRLSDGKRGIQRIQSGKVVPEIVIGRDFEGKWFQFYVESGLGYPVMIVERGLPLCLQESCDPVLVLSLGSPTSLAASISPRRTALGILLPGARDGRHIN